MTVPASPEAPQGDQDFIQNSYLTYIIPFATDYKLEKALKQHAESPKAFFESIQDREWLFFDETVDVYLVLRTAYLEEKGLRVYLSRLAITLEAQVVNHPGSDRDTSPGFEVIFNGTVENAGSPLVVVDDPGDSDEEDGEPRQIFAAWKLPVFLGRPRIRLQNPTVCFSAVAHLKPGEESPGKQRDGYLQSRAPLGLNMLESFADDPELAGVKPRLSAQRVSRVAPLTQAKDPQRPIKGLRTLELKVFPAVHTRVRFARPTTVPTSPSIIALLEVDFTPFFECEAVLSDIELSLPSAVVTDLNKAQGLSLPLTCVAHDHLTFMYKLSPLAHEIEASYNPTRDVDISIYVTALLKPGSCEPRLKMSWTTVLDFTLPVNPGFGTSLTNPSLQRAHRPSQLSIDGAASLVAPAVRHPDALPSLEAAARNTETTIPDFGITMTFTAPPGPIFPGDEFHWTVFVVNRSSAATTAAAPLPPPARKLALIALPRRRRNDVRVLRPPSSSTRAKGEPLVADAVLDENIVHAMQRSSLVDATDVVCLSADTRVGPLAPNACHVVQLRFVALRAGRVGVEAIRVVDLATQEHVDVRELPAMVVEERR